MKTVTIVVKTVVILLLCAFVASAAVTVTPAPNGTNIAGRYAADGATPAYRTIGDIVIAEGLPGDIPVQTNTTLILTAPTGWAFEAGSGSVAKQNGRDITTISIVVTATTITVTLSTDGITKLDDFTISGIKVQAAHYTQTTPVNILRTSGNPGTATITGITNDVTNFGTLSTDGIFPVELVSFKGAAKGLTAVLTWKTATELDNFGFQIERRTADGWQKMGFVPGAGTSNAPHDYAYADRLGSAGTYSYRLKQIDRDGAFTYSEVIEVAVGTVAAEFRLNASYPNPFNPATTISFTVSQTGPASLKVYNILGQQVAVLFAGTAETGVVHQVSFNAASLPSGIYFGVLESGSMRAMQKMMLSK